MIILGLELLIEIPDCGQKQILSIFLGILQIDMFIYGSVENKLDCLIEFRSWFGSYGDLLLG
jgi:hypothetical protein